MKSSPIVKFIFNSSLGNITIKIVNRKKRSISFKLLLILFVIVLGIVPLVLMQTVVNRTVRNNILKNTTILTQGILNQSQSYINLLLLELDTQIDLLAENEKIVTFIDEDGLSEKSLTQLLYKKKESSILSSFVFINIDENKDSLHLYPGYERYKYLNQQAKQDFLHSQQAEILIENNTKVLHLGSPPNGVNDAIPSLWTYRFITYKQDSYIIAGSLSREFLEGFLAEVASSSRSDVLLLSSDNVAYPFDNDFFSYPFAAEALSRSAKSIYNVLYNTRETLNGTEQLMIQIYTDPDYFYNLIILTPQKSLLRGYNSIEQTTNLTLFILAIVSVSLGLLLISLMNRRIKNYLMAVKNITGGQYNITLIPSKIHIVEDVTFTNANLEKIISKRTDELQKSLNELHMTRQSLIHSEKMAILGRQGAKIAHEMNNPLSVSITASSHMASTVRQINRKFIESKLTKSDFITLTETATNVSEIIQRNLKQASEMTKRFKNFASDQSRDEWKVIRIDNYIREIINSYSYKLKNTSYTMDLTCDEQLEVKTDPTIIYQTITNLINNSLLHGFEGKIEGRISIEIRKEGPLLFIIYKDDGNGISEEIISELYKPFFTTKADNGGTGLGLNIVKDLIEKELKGTIECISTLGEGAQFTITFPL